MVKKVIYYPRIGLAILLQIATLFALAAQVQSNDKLVYDLSGFSWGMEGTLPGEGMKKNFHKLAPDRGFAHVPGDVYTDLWRVGRIEDPHFGRNGLKAKWVMDYEWWYFRSIDLPGEMEGKQIRVMFDGVDFACDVWFNGEYLGYHEGAFSKFSFDITEYVKYTTENETRDNNMLSVKLAPPPRTFPYVSGRKYRWHGDYNYNLTPFGIWRPVWLEATGPVRIEDTYVESRVLEDGSASMDINLEFYNDSYERRELEIDINVSGENFRSETYSVSINKRADPGSSTYKIPIRIKDPELWWPWDMGDPNMYRVDVSVSDAESGLQDREKTSIGIRNLEMAMNPGWTKEEVEYPWTVMINGQRHYMRSGSWGGPPDMFTGRVTEEMYRDLIRKAKEANLNNLRIFNWHPPEIPLFYKICNEEGITVWQDLIPISGHPVMKDEAWKEAVFSEAISVLKQIRNNPCVVLIEGAEEILYTRSRDESDWALQFVTELGRAIKPYTSLHFVPTSPLSWPNYQKVFKPNESIHAHTPHYSEGRVLMEEYYTSLDYAVIPELAISSCPNVESIKKFIPEDELWPPGPSWGYHWADLDVFRIHNYEVLGDQFTESMDDFVEATQISQGTYFQFSLEHFRRRKPKTSAVCICHYNLNSPDMKWAIVDYYGVPKISHDYVRKAYQPLLVSLQYDRRRWLPGETFTGNIWVVNDYFKDYRNCTVKSLILDQDKKVVKDGNFKIGNVSSDSSEKFTEISCKVPGGLGDKFYVELTLLDQDGNVLSENDYFLLVADQEADRSLMKKMGEEAAARKRDGRTTFRYFPELQGDKYIPTEYIRDFK